MTAALAPPERGRLSPRGRITIGVGAALAWAVARAGIGDEIVNRNGWGAFSRFWSAVTRPELGLEFLRLTADAAAITLAYALLGTALSLVIGALGSLALSELVTERTARWHLARLVFVVPRAVHEILWALLLIQILGFDPLVAVLAIGLPFGAVTAKVFAEAIDEADPRPYHRLRVSGAGPLAALAYGVGPTVRTELVSYAFYRLECAIRSAAILGVIGAGGLGFQLDLSFETLRYHEIWTLIAALMVLSGLGDVWSSAVRRASDPRVARWSLWTLIALLPISWLWLGLDVRNLVSARTRRLAVDFGRDVFPPRLGPEGLSELVSASFDTVAMSLLALTIAGLGGLVTGALSARPTRSTARRSVAGRSCRLALRTLLLLLRAVPSPIWAFLIVLVFFPGLWPGAIALGLYNLGVLGRLFAEAFEDRDSRPGERLAALGASSLQRFFYASLPATGPRLTALALYRWEVITRETVVVGVVGAGGLGQLINEHLAARDFAAVVGAILALILISVLIDSISSRLRETLR